MNNHLKPMPSKGNKKDSAPNCMQQTSDPIAPPQNYVDITAMIRSLQRTEGLNDCFRRGLADCDQLECAWRQYCLEKPENAPSTPKKI